MEFILIIIFLMILLVPGFEDSVPPTGDKTFKIEYSDNVESIKTISDKSLAFWGFDVKLKQNSGGILDIKIPKNFPTPASYTGMWTHNDGKPFMVADGMEVSYETVEDPCYFHYKIPAEGKKNVEIGYTVILTGTWQLYSPIQFDKTVSCYNKVFYEKSHESPLKQIKSGIKFHNVECNEGLVLAQRGNTEKSACVKLDTKIELTVRGWAYDDRIILGCLGERVKKCYPEDKEEYRNALQHYYYGTEIKSKPESQSTIQFKAQQLGIDSIGEAIDSEDLSYDEKREYIKWNYEQDGPVTIPSLNMRIKNLTRNLEYGQLPTFTLIETGYANPCTSPKLEVYFIKEKSGYDLANDELIYEHRIVMKCPYNDKFFPILSYWSEQDFDLFPACIKEGRYLIVGDSGTERVALDEYYCNPK